MDFLLNNPLAKMPGTLFLLFYGATILLTAIIIKISKSGFDWTRKIPLPLIPQNPDAFELAYLRGGENEFARALVFALIHKGFLTLTKDGSSASIVLAENQPNWNTLSVLERNVLPWFQVTRQTKEIFDSYGLLNILKPYSAEYERKITQSNFLLPSDVAAKIRITASIAGLILVFLGAYKIFIALLSGRTNILFTVVLIVITIVVFWILSKSARLSSLGKKYISAVQQTFESLQARIQNSNFSAEASAPVFGGVDPFLLAVGVFGVGALAGTMYYEYGESFHRASSGGSWDSSSSCGSSCGTSCSSGDSGCSSGSSCGSGCGGCGGGGD
jgi:uncharacterized protein (TIGR04222 family)